MGQNKPLTLHHNFSWTFVGNLVYAGCQWGMLVVLAKLGSPEIVGQFTLGLAVTAPVFMLTNLQLRYIQATDVKHQYLFGDYLSLRIISTLLALLVIVVITLTAGYRWETSLIILLVSLAKAFESISDVFYGLLQKHERMDRIAMSMMIKGPLSLLVLGISVYISGSVAWGVLGLAVAWALVLFGYDIRTGTTMLNQSQETPNNEEPTTQQTTDVVQPRWDLKTLAKLVWLALPLGIVMMLISLNTNIPRYFIEEYLGERELGIFAAIAYLMMVGSMVINALGQSATPRLAKYYASGNGIAFRTLLLKLIGIGALLGGTIILVVFVAGQQILTLLYQPEYAQHKDLLVWLMVAAAMSYISSFLGYGMSSARYFRIQIPLFIVVTSTLAITCLWLLPIYGLRGAAFAQLIAASMQAVLSLGVNIHALYRIKKNTGRKSEPLSQP
ncbi:oligosaccharide flippase family protein [Brasilonema sp. UFV-L1]|uniref:lipopolysaccharide biosynthesis protein n=1 Tax=Brasilonema sp. UFV-L1 TaxID=2234130 RepID=UPI00145F9A7E|nr:oligosaccharide flippase family protein [Brasilonema sp. UFV-L1]NMG08834.1 lipopolysaccharide biosynthesis protein [Brasilonema sp. UFV-L1]